MRIAIHDYAGHPFQFELSAELARRGHEVRHFYFAEDIGPKGSAPTDRDAASTLSVEPVALGRPYSKTNFLRRRGGDIDYGRVCAARIAAFAPDVVLSGNTPLEAQSSIAVAARRGDAVFLFWMQDFYSLAIERLLGGRWMGVGQMVANYYKDLERRLLQASDGVVLISEDFAGPLAGFGVAPEKVAIIPNWGALPSIPLRPKTNHWAKRYGLEEKFVFLYSGTLALKHNPERLWALAESLRGDPQAAVVLAAAGVSLDALKARHAAARLPNLIFLPLQPMADFPDLLGAADVTVALLEEDAAEFSVPSKVLSYLCAGRPILLSAPAGNLAARIVERVGAGIVVAASDEATFLEQARRLRHDLALARSMGAAGRRYAEATFDIAAVTDRFEAAFAAAIGRRAAPARAGRHAPVT